MKGFAAGVVTVVLACAPGQRHSADGGPPIDAYAVTADAGSTKIVLPRSPFFLNRSVDAPALARESGATTTRVNFWWGKAVLRAGDPIDFSVLDDGVVPAMELDEDMIGILDPTGPLVEDVTAQENPCAFQFRCLALTEPKLQTYDGMAHPECEGVDVEVFRRGRIYRPTDMDAWGAFVAAVVERYDGDGEGDMPGLTHPIHWWQLGAEYPRVWCANGDTPGTEFARLLDETRALVRKVDPTAAVGMTGLVDVQAITLALADGFIAGPVTQGGRVVTREDVLASKKLPGVRELIETPLRTGSYDFADLHLYGRYGLIPDVATWLRSYSGERPIWAGEGGGPFANAGEDFRRDDDPPTEPNDDLLRENAAYVPKYYLSGVAAGLVSLGWHLTTEYELWGTPFGDLDLLGADGLPRPSFYAYAALARVATGMTGVARLADRAGATVMQITYPGSRRVWVLWSDGAGATVDVSDLAGAGATIYRLPSERGETETVPQSTPVSALAVGRVPVFVEGGL